MNGEEKILMEIAGLNRRFDGVDERLDGIDKRLDGIDQRFEAVDKRFDGIDLRFKTVDERFDNADRQFKAVDERFDNMDRQFKSAEERSDKYFSGIQLEFISVRREMHEEFAALRGEMHEGSATLAARDDVLAGHLLAVKDQLGEVSDRMRHLEEENTGSHNLDLHRRVRRLEKHVFKAQ